MAFPVCGDEDVLVLSCGDDSNVLVWDHKSCAVAGSFKNGNTMNHSSLVSVNGKPSRWSPPLSHSILSAQRDKPFVHVWHWGKVRLRAVVLVRCVVVLLCGCAVVLLCASAAVHAVGPHAVASRCIVCHHRTRFR